MKSRPLSSPAARHASPARPDNGTPNLPLVGHDGDAHDFDPPSDECERLSRIAELLAEQVSLLKSENERLQVTLQNALSRATALIQTLIPALRTGGAQPTAMDKTIDETLALLVAAQEGGK